MAQGKLPKSIKVEQEPFYSQNYPSFRITITAHQYYKLEPRASDMLKFWDSPNSCRYVCTRIIAKDELEALMRFRKLWLGLPKKEQKQ